MRILRYFFFHDRYVGLSSAILVSAESSSALTRISDLVPRELASIRVRDRGAAQLTMTMTMMEDDGDGNGRCEVRVGGNRGGGGGFGDDAVLARWAEEGAEVWLERVW